MNPSAQHIWLAFAFLCNYGSLYFIINYDATLGLYGRPLKLVVMVCGSYILYTTLSWAGNNPEVSKGERWFGRVFWAIQVVGIIIAVVVNHETIYRKLDVF
jgi:hypothetical protein